MDTPTAQPINACNTAPRVCLHVQSRPKAARNAANATSDAANSTTGTVAGPAATYGVGARSSSSVTAAATCLSIPGGQIEFHGNVSVRKRFPSDDTTVTSIE